MIYRDIEERLQEAVTTVIPDADLSMIQVRPCPDPQFGDFQSSAIMALAKRNRTNPRNLATEVVGKLDVREWCEPVEIAGPGFLNFRLLPAVLNEQINRLASADSLVEPTRNPRMVVVDFSSPNVAKPMHVGHIRSTLLGDCLARILRLLGHRVVTDNHIGDWGTQFGKLLVGWKTRLNRETLNSDPIAEMERLYKAINAASEADEKVLDQAREELVKLQSGDAENLGIWKEMIALSQHQFDEIYGRLGVTFDHTYGESFYNEHLQSVVDDLLSKNIARESQGAICVFSDGSGKPETDPFLSKREGEWNANPAIVQKSDGAANYMTTDLATISFREETWHPTEIAYVTDGRQQLHFRQLFDTVRRWKPDFTAKLAHVWFGSILGEDGKPFKTRSGETVRLADLLNEAEERALKVVAEKNPDLPEAERDEVARVVGLGAIKYADLSPNRQSDYVFSWEKMLALQGDTAPYLQYAYARVRSISRKAVEQDITLDPDISINVEHADEISLAKHLMKFQMTLESVLEDYRPNYLCAYLYELAGCVSRFYVSCPVLKAVEPQRSSRLKLCELAGRVLRQGLNALGIETLEQM